MHLDSEKRRSRTKKAPSAIAREAIGSEVPGRAISSAVPELEIFSVEVDADPCGVTVDGEKAHDVPPGNPLQEKTTAPLKP
jgi:hypothetical protein